MNAKHRLELLKESSEYYTYILYVDFDEDRGPFSPIDKRRYISDMEKEVARDLGIDLRIDPENRCKKLIVLEG